MKVHVSADSSPQYYGYYLRGFRQLFADLDVKFATRGLPKLLGPRDGLAMEMGNGRKVFIAADDHATVNTAALEWCDVYGQVNFDPANRKLPGGSKMIPLGPGFGVRSSSTIRSEIEVLKASLAGGTSFANPVARVRAIVKHQHDRLALADYRPGKSSDDQLFFLASFWHKHPAANTQRHELWQAMQSLQGIHCSGGFVTEAPGPAEAVGDHDA